MRQRSSLMIGLFLIACAAPARAEKANMSPQKLRDTATHVITGTVAAIYERTSVSGDWQYTHYVAEVRIDGVEKGDGLSADDLVYVRYWKRRWQKAGNPPLSTSGHRGLPNAGESLRIYLARNAYDGFTRSNSDGGFNVIGANGFEKLKPAATE